MQLMESSDPQLLPQNVILYLEETKNLWESLKPTLKSIVPQDVELWNQPKFMVLLDSLIQVPFVELHFNKMLTLMIKEEKFISVSLKILVNMMVLSWMESNQSLLQLQDNIIHLLLQKLNIFVLLITQIILWPFYK